MTCLNVISDFIIKDLAINIQEANPDPFMIERIANEASSSDAESKVEDANTGKIEFFFT